MIGIVKRWLAERLFYDEKDKRLTAAIKNIVGRKPLNLKLYHLAMRHSSLAKETVTGYKESNERLEYLGDAVLGMVIADYLFKRFPYKDEGFLTEIRSRIVNRESLNQLGRKIGIGELIEYEGSARVGQSYKSLYGDSLEALLGAVYLDRGFKFSKEFIIQKLLIPHHDLEMILKTNLNYKSQLIEWAQKENRSVRFHIEENTAKKGTKIFISEIYIDEKPISQGQGFSKKKAEQDAAQKACDSLGFHS